MHFRRQEYKCKAFQPRGRVLGKEVTLKKMSHVKEFFRGVASKKFMH
jgi:hypothetical protein